MYRKKNDYSTKIFFYILAIIYPVYITNSTNL